MKQFYDYTSLVVEDKTRLTGGHKHNSYSLITRSGNKYFLKCAESDTLIDRLNHEVNTIFQLESQGFDPYIPFITESGFTDDFGYMVTPYYPHVPLDWKDTESVTRFVESTADFLRKMHNGDGDEFIEETGNIPAGYEGFGPWLDTYESETIDKVKNTKYDEYIPDIKNAFSDVRADTELEELLVHGDFHIPNLRLRGDGSILKVVDWDRTSQLDVAYEIARTEIRIFDLYSPHTEFSREELCSWFRDAYGLSEKLVPRVEAYKKAYVVRTAYNMNNGGVFDSWRKVGTNQECVARHDKLVSDLLN